MAGEEELAQLVVVGAPASGVEALATLLSTLPPDLPAPIVVTRDTDAQRSGPLAEVLAGRSRLPVRAVEAGEPLRPGTVYAVPADRRVRIADHSVSVSEDAADGAASAIDRLLASAAGAFGERVIAVVLSGTGAHGAGGALAVKEAGGAVVVQNAATADDPGLSASLPAAAVDVAADLEAIGPLLARLLSGASPPSTPRDERVLRLFLDRLRQRTGFDHSVYERPSILRRLQRRMAAVGAPDLRAYVRYVDAHPDEQERLVGAFLTRVTRLLSDRDLFEHLRSRVLPRLVAGARGRGNELRLWSAGCATGEDAYALAMLAADVLGDELERFSVRVFATDADESAVRVARRGVYPPGAFADLPVHLGERYLTRAGGHFEVRKLVRGLVVFGQHDLGRRPPFPRIDLVLCRNLLVSFTPELQGRVLELFTYALREGGCLVLGKAETIGPPGAYFDVDEPRLRVYRRHGGPISVPTMPLLEGLPGTVHPTPGRPSAPPPEAPGTDDARLGDGSRSEAVDRLLRTLPIGVAVVDRRYDVRRINPAARRLLGIRGPAVGEDLLHLLRGPPPSALRAAIDAALRGETRTLDELTVEDGATGERRVLRIVCGPQAADRADPAGDAAQVVVVDRTGEAAPPPAPGADEGAEPRDGARAAPTDPRQLAARVRQLQDANRELLEANEKLIEANAELTSARDASLVGSEEAQAALEEVETLNEEQQATNEELETLNEELHATVEELRTTNEDLAARDAESRAMAASREAVLAAMGDAVSVVDQAGDPVRTNAAYDRLRADRSDGVVEGEDGRPVPPDQTPERRAARGESFTTQFTLTRADGSRRWFEANGRPVPAAAPEVGVVAIRDITERSLRRLQEEFVGLAAHELRTPLTVLRAYLQRLNAVLPGGGDERSPGRMAAAADEQARRLGALVRDLQDVTRLQSAEFPIAPEEVELRTVVGTAVETARALAGGRTIAFDAPGEPLRARADPGRLQQVVLNLLTNALQHAPGSERIDVRLRRVGETAELEVQDHGPGIPAEHLPHLFSRFYRVAGAGTPGLGLGLVLTRAIVVAHGGTVDVRSAEGRGSTFTVRLPLSTADTAARELQ